MDTTYDEDLITVHSWAQRQSELLNGKIHKLTGEEIENVTRRLHKVAEMIRNFGLGIED